MFELLTKTKTKLLDVVVLSQKNRHPDDNPGAKLSVEMMLSNDILAYFDGSLRSFLFTKNPVAAIATGKSKQTELDGVDPISDTPNLTAIGSHVGALHWDDESTGFTFVVDLGLGGKLSNLELGDCKLSNWRLIPKEGGTVVTRFDIESNDVSEKSFGRLAKLKSREIEVLLLPPEVTQEDLDPVELTPAQLRAANAKGLTIEQAKAQAKEDGTPSPAPAPKPAKAWPFPEGDGPDAKSKPPKDAADAVLADVKKNGPAGKPAAKKMAPAKKVALKRKTAVVA